MAGKKSLVWVQRKLTDKNSLLKRPEVISGYQNGIAGPRARFMVPYVSIKLINWREAFLKIIQERLYLGNACNWLKQKIYGESTSR